MVNQAPSLATKAAESELRACIETLKQQLDEARQDLRRLVGDVDAPSENHTSDRLPMSPSRRNRAIVPPKKQGYLFKWQDREIGWGGSKWALRFVALEKGRLSYYGAHTDISPRYSLPLLGCAVRDEGWKRNRRHRSKSLDPPPLDEVGAYFFVFSIYQRPGEDRSDDVGAEDSEIIPLLRFSTPSLAEKSLWLQLISSACEYCESDAFFQDEMKREAEEFHRIQEQQVMSMTLPEAKEGTLPPLYFAPPKIKLSRTPSFSKHPPPQVFKTNASNIDADKVDTRSVKGYPPSKPMHRAAAPSLLSTEAPVQNYRGFFNLGIILLILSNFRLILETVRRHGFVLFRVADHVRELSHFSEDPWREFPFLAGFLLQLLLTSVAFVVEWALSRRKIPERLGMLLHHVNGHAALLVPGWIVWNSIDSPVTGAILLFHGVITWMKLISFFHANEDYRLASRAGDSGSHAASLALVENLDPEDANLVYPQNVTMRNMLFFWCAPTLTYQIAFPRSPHVRPIKIIGIVMRMIICVTLFTFLVAQIVSPALDSLIKDLEATGGRYTTSILADYWLRLAIANTYLWLLVFYFYFHLYLNLFAEVLRFGDRVFYADWWNSASLSSYWRLWNKPVHYWLARHVYFPCVRMKIPKMAATFLVFFLSAVMHEVLVSIPHHMVRPWSFLGMMMQIPLIVLTKYLYKTYPGSSLGNIIFWISFCVVGQPMAIMLYAIDYRYSRSQGMGVGQCVA